MPLLPAINAKGPALPAGLQGGAGPWRADWLGAETLGLDGDEHVGALHEGDGGLADFEAKLLDGGVGDGAGDGQAVLGGDGHMAVDGALLDFGDLAAELVAGRDLQVLAGLGEHDVGGLDHGDGGLAGLEAEILDGLAGDVGLDVLAGGNLDGDDGVDGALLDGDDGAGELVASGDLHGVRPFVMCGRLPLQVPRLVDEGNYRPWGLALRSSHQHLSSVVPTRANQQSDARRKDPICPIANLAMPFCHSILRPVPAILYDGVSIEPRAGASSAEGKTP